MSIKKLAGQTLWYGIPSIATRFLGYILNFSLIYLYQAVNIADITQVYALFPFLNILFTYGLETSYFRFLQEGNRSKLYNTLSISIFLSTILLTVILLLIQSPLATLMALEEHPEYITYMAGIVFLDTLSALPFARLRQEERPRRYAFIKLSGILINVLVVIWYLGICPGIAATYPGSVFLFGYDPSIGIAYYLVGNIVGSAFTLFMLFPQLRSVRPQFDVELWKRVMVYTIPLIIVGFGGMINDMLSRLVFQHVTPLPELQAKHELGVFAANYRLAILITIFIQMFRLAAEPFFFKQSRQKDAPETYARVMLYFVIACSFMFLFVSVYLPLFRELMTLRYPDYGEGIEIVPILALGGVFLGIYYNLSIWYKLSNKNWYGAAITLSGAAITIVLNMIWIPRFGYFGSAWATLVCYLFMMIVSYLLGQKYYPVPYPLPRILTYLVLMTGLAVAAHYIHPMLQGRLLQFGFGTVLLMVFAAVVILLDRKNFTFLPVIGRYLK